MIESPEYEHSENKSSLSEWKEAAISLAAFATARGGTVHLGVSPEGKRLGVMLGKNSLENLANDIRRNTDPPLFPSIRVEGEERSALVHVSIEESPIKPVWAFGKPYKRVGRTNQSLSREETLRLVEATTGRTWDGLPCAGLREEVLSRTAVEDFLHRSGLDTNTPTITVLDNLRLRLPDSNLCNAAALLFADPPSRYLDGVQVKCGRFRGNVPVDFLDQRTLEGSVISQLEEALVFVARNTRQAIRITGRPEREIVPEYPDAAIREAITNAICHRDYTAAGQVQVRIFNDGLEVWNPANLPADLTLQQLYEPHGSRPRNRKLAEAFYRARLIEQWGTGTLRMVQACEERQMARPEFRYEMGFFIVQFTSSTGAEESPAAPYLTDRQRRTLEYVQQHGAITTAEYQRLFHLSERQARRDLRAMVASKLLALIGMGPSSRYIRPD